jgi:large repetitive protein
VAIRGGMKQFFWTKHIASNFGKFLLWILLFLNALVLPAQATNFTMNVPGTALRLPTGYPEAGGIAIVFVGVNGNAYYQFSNPTGAFQGFQDSGTPAAFRGNPFTINNPIALDCGFSTCSTYFGGAIAQAYVRFTAYDGDTQVGGFDENDITLRLNGFDLANWSGVNTEKTSNDGLTSFGFETGFGNNTLNTGWFSSTNAALLSNILSTGRTTSQVFDRDRNDNFWDFTIGNSLSNNDIVTVAPGYTLDKTSNRTTFTAVGQQIVYSYVVTNIGSVPIRSLSVLDNKITGVTCNKSVILDTNPGGVADFATCTGTYTVTQADFDARQVTNIARARGTPDFGTLGELTDTVTVTGPALTPSLTIDKATTATRFGAVGTTVPYTFRVTNTGNATLTGVTVTDPRLPGLSCTVASLAPAGQLNCSANYTVTQADVDAFAAGTSLVNTASVTSRDPTNTARAAQDTNTLPGPVAAPAMTVTKVAQVANFSAVGAVIPYQITVRNTGNVTWPAAPTVTDPLAAVTCPAGAVAPNTQIVCTANYTVTQANINTGSIQNTASASITVGGVTATGQGSSTVNAVRTTGLVLDKRLAAASPTSFAATGVTLRYDYALTNSGNVTLNAVAVTDNLTTVSCPATTIAPGTTLICTSTFVTTQANLNAGNVTNTASATSTAAGTGTAVASNGDAVTVPAVQTPALTMDKTAPVVTPAAFVPGAVVTYSYQVINSGNVTLAGPITVADNKAGSFTCAAGPIAPTASVTCTRNYTITAADFAAGTVVNTATASANGTTSNQDSATIAPNLQPGITMVKTANPTTVSALTDTITYTFAITNSGNTAIVRSLQPITVNDPRVGAVSCAAQPATLAAGSSFSCTATATPTQAELNAGQVVNRATASFPFSSGGQTITVTSPEAGSTVTATQTSSLVLTKTGPTNFSTVGQSISYGFAVRNTGNVTLTNVVVTDPLIPALSCTLTNIAPLATANCTGTYVVKQADIDAAQIVNTATARGATAGGAAPTDTDTITTPINPASAVKSATITKTASRTSFSAVGQQITYTIAVRNTGTQTLSNIAVTDVLDSAFSCSIPTLAPGVVSTLCQFSHTVTQADLNAGKVDNTARAASPDFATITSSVSVPGPARTASFTAVKSALNGYTAAGNSVQFRLLITNTGNVTLTNITVSDPLLSAGNACVIASLAPGAIDNSCLAALPYTATQANVDAGSVTNTASVTATAPAGVTAPTPRTATATATGPTAAPSVQVRKTPSTTTYTAVGQPLAYTFAVENTGNVTLTGLTVTDAALGFSCTLANLAPGAVATTCANGTTLLQASRVTTQTDIDRGEFSNTARVTGTTAVGGTPVEDTDTVSVSGPSQTPTIGMAKAITAGDLFDAVGDVVSYSYTITNTGNITLTAPISVADTKIPAVNCPGLPSGGLAPLATLVCTGTYSITQADLDAGSVTNSATGGLTQPVIPVNPGDPAFVVVTSAPDTATANSAQLPSISIDKRVKAGTTSSFAAVGDTVTFEYVVRNTGNVTTTADVTIADDKIPGTLICAPAGLAPAATAICEQDWTADQAALNAGAVTNTAVASTVFGGNPVNSVPDTATVTAVQSPELTIAKTLVPPVPAAFDAGEVLNYSYVVTNTGNVTITGPITVADNLTTVTCPVIASLAPSPGPGSTVSCTASYTIGANDLTVGSTTNIATANGTFDGDAVQSTPASVTFPVTVTAALSVAKTTTTTDFDAVGDTISYSYRVTNSGLVGFIDNVFIDDDKIGSFICRPSSLGIFSVNATFDCARTYTITQADVDRGFVTNTASARTVFAPGTGNAIPVQSPTDSVTVTALENPALAVVKTVTAGPNPAQVGDVLTYSITTTNSGNQTVQGVAVSDPLIPALTCTVGGTPAPANVVLLPTEALVCTGTYTVQQADIDAQVIDGGIVVLENTATAVGSDPQGDAVGGTGSTTHPLEAAAASIETVKVIEPEPGPDDAFSILGQTVNFRVTVTNTGNITLNNVRVTDDLQPGVTCTIATLAPAAADNSCTFSYAVTQADLDAQFGTPPDTFGGFINTATAVAQPATPGAPEVSDEGEVFAKGPANEPGFTLVKTPITTSFDAVGDVLTYSYTVANTGNVTLTAQPVVTDDRIGTFNCGSVPGGGLLPGGFVTCQATYTVTQADLNAGSVTNIASVESTQVPLPTIPGAAQDTATVTGTRTPGLTVAKVPSVTGTVGAGDVITYTYTVANTGNVTLTAITPDDQHTSAGGTAALTIGGDALVTDAGPAAGDTTDGGPDGVWDTLGPGDSVSFTSTYTVTQADVDAGAALTNIVTVTSQSPAGTTPPVATDDASVDVDPGVAALLALKTADISGLSVPPAVGNVVAYTITVENTGNVTISNVTLADTLTDANGVAQALDAAPVLASGDDGDGLLQVDETWTYTAAVTLTQAMIDAGGLSNTATVSGETPGSAPVSDISDDDGTGDSDPTVTNLDRAPAIAVVKTSVLNDGGDGRADVGDTITYSYVVSNQGNTTVFDISLAETGFTGAGPAPTPAIASGGADLDGEGDGPDLAVAGSATYEAIYTLEQADIDAGLVINQATATASDPAGTPLEDLSGATTGDDTPTETPLGSAPGMLALKTADTAGLSLPPAVGDVLTYTITVENTGNVTISNVTLADTLTDATGGAQALDAAPVLASGDDGDGLLQIDETWSYTANVTLTQAMIDAGGLSNTATVSGETPAGAPISDVSDDDGTGDSDPTVTNFDRSPVIASVKTAVLNDGGDGRADVGDTISYAYVVSNEGNTTLFDIGLTETGFTGAGPAPTPTLTAGGADLDGQADAPDLAVGGSATFAATYTLQQADIDAGTVTNQATATASDPTGAAVDDLSGADVADDTPTETPLGAVPGMVLIKTADATGVSVPPVVGDLISYTFTVENTGNVTIANVAIADTLTDANGGAQALDAAPALVSGDDGDGLLQVDETWTYTAAVTLTQSMIDAGGLSNTATVSGETPGGAPVQDVSDDDGTGDSDPTVTTLARSPAIAVVKTSALDDGGDGQADVGDTITYTYVVSNAGNATLFDAGVTETGFAGAGTVPTPTLTAGGADLDGEADAPDLAVGASATFEATYALVQADIDAGSVTNQATATANDPVGAPLQDLSGATTGDDTPTVTPLGSVPGMLALKTADVTGLSVPPAVGDILAYSITVENSGNVTISNVTLADTLTDANGSAQALDAAPVLASGDDGDGLLQVDETWTYTANVTLTQAMIDAGGLSNTATVTGETPGGDPVEDISDDDGTGADDPTVTTFDRTASMTVTKVPSITSDAVVGDVITYTYTVINTGNVLLTAVTLDDQHTSAAGTVALAIAGDTLDTDNGAAGDSVDASADGVWDTLGPNDVVTFTATYTVTLADVNAGAPLENTITVTATGPTGTTAPDATATVSVPLVPAAPAITAVKSSVVNDGGDGVVNVGDTLTYTYVLTNAGNVTLFDVALAETGFSGAGATPVPAVQSGGSDLDGEADAIDLAPGDIATFQAIYTLVQADIDAGDITNQATASADDPLGNPVTDLSGATATDDDPTVTTLPATPAFDVVKSASEVQFVFPTVERVTFTIAVTNSGNITQTGIQLTDDLAAFLAPAVLLNATYPVTSTAVGFTDGTANAAYDGDAVTTLLAGNPTLEPGATGTVTITLTYSTANGAPGGENIANATSDQLIDPVPSNPVTVPGGDSDGDGIPDSLEGCGPGDDRDGDGICDAEDYDPTGTFYCEEDGRILSGGNVAVTGPGGTQSGVGSSGGITIVRSGADGRFQFYVTAPGTYTLSITYPASGVPSTTRPSLGTLDVTSLLPANPGSLGSGEAGTTGQLVDFSAGANTYYTTFVFEEGDPFLINNNIPLSACATRSGVIATKVADRESAVLGETVNYTVSFNNTTALLFPAASLIDILPEGLVYSPGSGSLNGVATEPTQSGSRLNWGPRDVAAGEQITVRLSARVTSAAGPGKVVNRALMLDQFGTQVSNTATAAVLIKAEQVFSCSDVIGKVFVDRNGNGVQDPDAGRAALTTDDVYVSKLGKFAPPPEPPPTDEAGLPGVRLATVNGLLISTDEFGRYHVPCAALPRSTGSNFTLKLDLRSLPVGYTVTTENPRTLRLTAGKVAKINFGVSDTEVVDIDLTAAAFAEGSTEASAALDKGIRALIADIKTKPSSLRLTYVLQSGEDKTTAVARLQVVEKMIRKAWRGVGQYELQIQKSVKRVQ